MRKSVRITEAIFWAVLCVLVAAVFANSLTKEPEHDEQMYCTAAVLTAQGRMIYRDFSYVAQLPYHPLLCAALFKLSGTSYYLLTVRLLSAFCDVLVVVCIVAIYRRAFQTRPAAGKLLAVAAAVIYVFNPFVDYSNGFAWNHDLVVLSVMGAFLLFQATDFEQKSRYWKIAATGALLTFATCMRITTAIVYPLFLLFLFCRPARSLRARARNILPFLAASAAVAAWPMYVIAQAPRAFYLNVVRIPVLNGQFLHRLGTAYSKPLVTLAFLTEPPCLLLVLTAVCICLMLFIARRQLHIGRAAPAGLAAALVIVFFAIAYIPVTAWQQYVAVPIPFLVVSFAYPLEWLRDLGKKVYFKTACGFLVVSLAVAMIREPTVLTRVWTLFKPARWAPVRFHRMAEDIVANAPGEKLILTLSPLLALEGGGSIYDEFSAGVFAYRVADQLSETERKITHTAGFKTVAAIAAKAKPSAVVLGTEPDYLEEPILRTVIEPDMENWELKVYDDRLKVYFRKMSANSDD